MQSTVFHLENKLLSAQFFSVYTCNIVVLSRMLICSLILNIMQVNIRSLNIYGSLFPQNICHLNRKILDWFDAHCFQQLFMMIPLQLINILQIAIL